MARIRYCTVDVFTSTRFGGNPLAVFPDARSFNPATMQRIAAEFNYSETTFVLPPADPANTAQVRIFTPAAEIPFAGHPNVGTGYVLGRDGTVFGRAVGDRMVFEEGAGLVQVEVLRTAGAVTGGRIRAPQAPQVGRRFEPVDIAPLAGLDPADLTETTHPPVEASVGLTFICAEVGSMAAVGQASPSLGAFQDFTARYPAPAGGPHMLLIYTRDTGTDGLLRARMFPPLIGVNEDPATGSAAAALGGLLGTLHDGPDGVLQVSIDQGVEMGRPSRIEVDVTIAGGSVSAVTVAGPCVPVMSGELELDVETQG